MIRPLKSRYTLRRGGGRVTANIVARQKHKALYERNDGLFEVIVPVLGEIYTDEEKVIEAEMYPNYEAGQMQVIFEFNSRVSALDFYEELTKDEAKDAVYKYWGYDTNTEYL